MKDYKEKKIIEKQKDEVADGVLSCDEKLIVKALLNMFGHSIEKHQMKIRAKIHGTFKKGHADQIFLFLTKK